MGSQAVESPPTCAALASLVWPRRADLPRMGSPRTGCAERPQVEHGPADGEDDAPLAVEGRQSRLVLLVVLLWDLL